MEDSYDERSEDDILKLRDVLVKLRNLAKHSNKVDKSTARWNYLTLT